MRTLYITLLFFAMACTNAPKEKNELPGNNYSFFIGSYTSSENEGIYNANINTSTGELRLNGLAAPLENPSYLSVSGDYLFAVSETGEGKAFSYGIDRRTLRLFPIDTMNQIGSAPCFISIDNTGFSGYIANYGSGDVLKFGVDNLGRFTSNPVFQKHWGNGPDENRQEKPHAHSIKTGPDGRIYAADLGSDKIYIYGDESFEKADSLEVRAGNGPRHLEFNKAGNRLYVIDELSSTISVYASVKDDFTFLQTVSTLPDGYSGSNKTADIHLHPNGKYLYGSNRGHDSIVYYTVGNDGKLEIMGWLEEEVSWPRNFNITPDGSYLLVANRNGNSVGSYPLVNGTPGALSSRIEVKAPVCIQFYQ